MKGHFLVGLFYYISLFLVCVIIAFILNALFRYLMNKYQPKPKHKRKYSKHTKPIKSIEINPDEVERIYVKKSS